jgi:hypothetical protein
MSSWHGQEKIYLFTKCFDSCCYRLIAKTMMPLQRTLFVLLFINGAPPSTQNQKFDLPTSYHEETKDFHK